MKRTIVLGLYIAMCVWLVIASIGRVGIMLQGQQSLDALPFIGASLGAVSLLVLLLTQDRNPGDRS